jgi:dethiobiotin synthetase
LSRLLFITGTDTGVGKTLLTALLLRHLRGSGVNALALKPFCSGGTEDIDLIQAVQDSELPRDWVNPFYFPEPVAPLIASRRLQKRIRLNQALAAVRRVERVCDCLLIEGSGGLLVPLGENFTVADLLTGLHCPAIVVARNRLGTLNHTLLTVEAMRARGIERIMVALMGPRVADEAAPTNAEVLVELLSPLPVVLVPYLGARASQIERVGKIAKKIQKTLACLADFASFSPRSLEHAPKRAK